MVYGCSASSCPTSENYQQATGYTGARNAHNANRIHTTEPTSLALRCLGGNQLVQALAAALFHPFEAEAQVDGKLETECLVGLEDIQPSKDGPLVVRRSASNQSASFVVYDEGEWLRVPAIALVGLLQSTRSAVCRAFISAGDSQAARRSGRR